MAPSKTPRKIVRRTDSVKRAAFLAAISKCGNIAHAARLAKINRSSHYVWLQADGYLALYDQAHTDAVEALEHEARTRAVGHMRAIFYKGEKIGQYREGSDNLLMFLLKAAKPDYYRENAKVEVSGEINVIIERLNAARTRLAAAE